MDLPVVVVGRQHRPIALCQVFLSGGAKGANIPRGEGGGGGRGVGTERNL